MATEVTVTVPDGVYEGEEFTLEYEGSQLTVVCPDGCGPGDAVNLQIDLPPASEEGMQQLNIVIPDGCYPGDEFTVDFEGRMFNIAVPDGCEPGVELTVDVPPAEETHAPSHDKYRDVEIPPYREKGSHSKAGSSQRNSDWAPSTSLFSMGPPEGFGNPAGNFHVGQVCLCLVSEVNGSIPRCWRPDLYPALPPPLRGLNTLSRVRRAPGSLYR